MAENEEEITPSQPEATQVADHVEQAAESATTVAQKSGEHGWQTLADELKGLRADITRLLSSTQDASEPENHPSAAAPEVEVETPNPPARRIRRNGRKVTRH